MLALLFLQLFISTNLFISAFSVALLLYYSVLLDHLFYIIIVFQFSVRLISTRVQDKEVRHEFFKNIYP